VLNVTYLNNGAVKTGGFYPSGVAGVFSTSGYGYVERYDIALDSLIEPDAVVEEAAGEFNWIEGPCWVGGPDGYLLTSHPRDTFITRFNEREGSSLYLQPSGAPLPIDPLRFAEPGSNGLFLGRGGLLVVDGSLRALRVLDLQTKTFRTIVDRFEGKQFNSPNDIAVSPRDGAIFFTDPAYGLRGGLASPLRELDYTGVFRVSVDNVVTLIGKYDRPNGIGVSPDGNTLYVTDVTRGWIAVTLDANGKPAGERDFIRRDAITGGDGLKIDRAGNMWASYANGITIVTPEGKRIGSIRVNDTAANCEIGGDGYLYIASNRRLARIKVKAQKLLIPRFS
jgi:gluconolactonase